MGRKKKQESVNCIVYLSTKGDIYTAEKREQRQLRYITDYAKAHNIIIRKKLHRDVLGQNEVNRHWDMMTAMVREGVADGILIANMATVSTSIPDAFFKVGKVYDAGGVVITVDEGVLSMPVKRMKNGRVVPGNEKC